MASFSTNSSYYYTTTSSATFNESVRPVATIIRTKLPRQQWSDVLEVSINGANYTLGDIVKIVSGGRSEFGRVEEFKPSTVRLSTINGDCRFYYDEITSVKSDDKPDIKPDPNRAFLIRKKEML